MALFGKFQFLKGHYGENCVVVKIYDIVEIMNVSDRRISVHVDRRLDSPVNSTAQGHVSIDPGHRLVVEVDRVNFSQLRNLEMKEIIELRQSKRKFNQSFI